MVWRVERDDGQVCDARRAGLGVVLDLVFLLVEFVFSQEVVDGFVVLKYPVRDDRGRKERRRTISRNWPSILYSQPLDLRSSATRKTCSTARGIMPEALSD